MALSLAQEWSLPPPPTCPYIATLASSEPTSPEFNLWFFNNLLMGRMGLNAMAHLVPLIPDSESRARDEGVIAYYNHLYSYVEQLKSVARERGLPMPKVPHCSPDWREESQTDNEGLCEVLLPQAAEPVQRIYQWLGRLMTKYKAGMGHWSSLAAATLAGMEMYKEAIGLEKGSVAGPGGDGLLECTDVMREEIERLRNDENSGWKESEARGETMEYCTGVEGFLRLGLEK